MLTPLVSHSVLLIIYPSHMVPWDRVVLGKYSMSRWMNSRIKESWLFHSRGFSEMSVVAFLADKNSGSRRTQSGLSQWKLKLSGKMRRLFTRVCHNQGRAGTPVPTWLLSSCWVSEMERKQIWSPAQRGERNTCNFPCAHPLPPTPAIMSLLATRLL